MSRREVHSLLAQNNQEITGTLSSKLVRNMSEEALTKAALTTTIAEPGDTNTNVCETLWPGASDRHN